MSIEFETNPSLIMRLPSQSDSHAWAEFVRIYEPMIYQFGRRRGLQDADARELVQNVMLGVARAVERWTPDASKGRFRTWLMTIARNQWISMISKHRQDAAAGGTSIMMALQQCSSPSDSEELLREYRREVFRIAAARVRQSFQPRTWDSFWRTAVLAEKIEVVASELGMSVGAVYIARGRVTQRLREVIQQWEQDDAL
jgi:RNA polymerase sigma factor (sigma-70 family)